MHELILELADRRAILANVGSKGASLARLVDAGLPVPGGFHVSTGAYARFVADNELQPAILEAVRPVSAAEPSGLETASRTIADLFARAPMPPDIADAIGQAYAALPGQEPPVAVRSSGTAEDLPDLSFAGQQETFLNVHEEAAVLEAVKRCWASLWTARAIAYRAQHGVDQSSVSLAVVVQLLVPADAAGVLFTANPISGMRTQAMATATWGLGEAIVSSTVTPDTLVVDKASGRVVERQTADKQVMTVRTQSGTEERPTPDSLRRATVLSDAQVADLTSLGVRIEALYGMPMDIEWALHNGSFAILQARPITALAPEPAPLIEWKLPKPGGSYARASIIELLPEPLTPLFGTLGVREINLAYQRLGNALFKGTRLFTESLVVLINDYAYYDIAFTPRQTLLLVVQMPSFGTFLLSTAERRWKQEARPRYAAAVAHWQTQNLDALPSHELLRGVREIFAVAMDHYIYTVQGGILPAAYMSEAAFTWFYEKFVRRGNDPTALSFVLGFDSLPIRADKSLYDVAQWCIERPAVTGLLSASSSDQLAAWLRDDVHAPAEEWPDFRVRFAEHLARFGHAIYDLDFAKPTPADDPRPLLETLKLLIQGRGSDPHQRQREATFRREQAVRRVAGRLRGWRRAPFRRLLNWAQRYAPLREDALGDTGLGWPLLRRMLLLLGARFTSAGAIGRPEDTFWLTEDEVSQLATELDLGASHVADLTHSVGERNVRIRAEMVHTPPPSLPAKPKFAGFDFSRWLPARAEQQVGNRIKGLGASPGTVTATARVLRGPEDFGQMRPGDVLVAAITTPAWTPLFALAAAVVTDVGGPLSHSSIVAREYGVPAVLGTGVATRRIRSGDRITVDGTTGVVTLAADSGA